MGKICGGYGDGQEENSAQSYPIIQAVHIRDIGIVLQDYFRQDDGFVFGPDQRLAELGLHNQKSLHLIVINVHFGVLQD